MEFPPRFLTWHLRSTCPTSKDGLLAYSAPDIKHHTELILSRNMLGGKKAGRLWNVENQIEVLTYSDYCWMLIKKRVSYSSCRAPIDRGVPLSPSEENDFFAASMMSHSKSEPNSIALSTNVTDSPGRRTRATNQQVIILMVFSSGENEAWWVNDDPNIRWTTQSSSIEQNSKIGLDI